MDQRYAAHGQKGTGSVPIEAILLLPGEPYEVVERAPLGNREAGGLGAETGRGSGPCSRSRPLVLPKGELMTASAASSSHLAPAIRPRAFAAV